MSPENKSQALIPTTSGELTIPDSQRMVIIILQSTPSARTTNEIAQMMDKDPAILDKTLDVCDLLPHLVNEARLKDEPKVGASLKDIRANFPEIIDLFDDARCARILNSSGSISSRIEKDRENFKKTNIKEEIKTCELIVRRLIEDGSVTNFTEEECANIVASHELYMTMINELDESPQAAIAEQTKFIQVGQRLGRLRRLLDPKNISVEMAEAIKERSNLSEIIRTGHKPTKEMPQDPREKAAIQIILNSIAAKKKLLVDFLPYCTNNGIAQNVRRRINEYSAIEKQRITQLKESNALGQPFYEPSEFFHQHGSE